ncbi:ParB family protein [Enterovibrio paralichthyis]|uniref:ParB family protein n=1 Tax=Enterovibrio paralichthyis TaxID=2853805 RepID=UPI001C48FBA5|nr:ParB family protein [Enterovibrio paralichthyis]MBV7299804.1 hypothetical protein [Enterovibrio paralichthyis]
MSKKAFKPLGRDRFMQSSPAAAPSAKDAESAAESVATLEWKMQSGLVATFHETELSYETLLNNSFVDEEINGRNQQLNTATARAALTRSLKRNQYLPVIVKLHPDGQYEFLDGSRRRLSALELKRGLRALVTKDNVIGSDAKALAREIQKTVKEHSLYEFGLELIATKQNDGLNQKELAALYQVSERKISDAVKAGEIPISLVELYPSVNDIAIADFKTLHKHVFSTPEAQREAIVSQVVSAVSVSLANVHSVTKDEVTEYILKAFDSAFEKPAKPEKPAPVTLADFDSPFKYARYTRSDRKVTIELSRLNVALVDDILEMIKERLER